MACEMVAPKLEEDVDKWPSNEIQNYAQYDKVSIGC